jgi:hypothetical protein
VDHLFGCEIGGAVALMVDDDHAASAFDLA